MEVAATRNRGIRSIDRSLFIESIYGAVISRSICRSPAEDNIIRQLVFVGVRIVREMVFERFSNLRHHSRYASGITGFIEMRKDVAHLPVPEFVPHLFMNAPVPKDGQLAVPERDIDQDAVAGYGFFHLQPDKDLGGPVQRIDITAMPFYVYPHLAAGAALGVLDGGDDLLLLLVVEERFAFEKGHTIGHYLILK